MLNYNTIFYKKNKKSNLYLYFKFVLIYYVDYNGK